MIRKKFAKIIKRSHRDEKGEMPIGPMLIIGLIVIPLVTLLIVFKDQVTEYVTGESQSMFSQGSSNNAGGMAGKKFKK